MSGDQLITLHELILVPSCRAAATQSQKNYQDEWFSTPPSYTAVRVNLLLTSVNEVSTFISDYLVQKSVEREQPAPLVDQHDVLPDCIVIHPWWRGDKVLPRHANEVIVDAVCGRAVLRGANVFAPGVLATSPSIQEGDEVSVYADAGGKCRRGLIAPFTDSGKTFVGNGTMKMSRRFLFQNDTHPRGVAVEVTHPASGVATVNIPPSLGLLQNLPSIVCGHVVSPQPGDIVLDMCAAPGHKTTHLATLMDNQGILVALDKITRKVDELITFCRAMNAQCVKAFAFDSTKAVSTSPGPDWSPPFSPELFHHVLLDAPCSALGQRPRLGSRESDKHLTSYPKLQKKLFSAGVQLVKPGGSLVYSTCSLAVEENEDIVSWALVKFPQLQLVPAHPFLGKFGSSESSLSQEECLKVQRFGPPLGPRVEDDTIGFFIAKFVKRR